MLGVRPVVPSILHAVMDARAIMACCDGDVHQVGEGFRVSATHNSIVAGIACAEKKIYAVQFHPEVNLTTNGKSMFSNFLFKIAGCSGSYTMEDRETMCIREINEIVGDKKVLCLVSGGVDSSVCAALLNKAIGPERVVRCDNSAPPPPLDVWCSTPACPRKRDV